MPTDHQYELPLFAWTPPCRIIAFPMVARVGKIRDVAGKMLTKTTDTHRDWYMKQVTEALINQFERIGATEIEQDRHINGFWLKVESEMNRLCYRGSAGSNDPRGVA